MNNTKSLTVIAAILIAATLVVGILAITTTKTAFAASNNNSGNTVTAQINRQHGSGSGFDNDPEQEGQNTICTHPESGASCVSENGATTTPVTTPTGTLIVKKLVECRVSITICPSPSDFTITVTGNNPTPSTFQVISASGTLVTLGVGAYKVSEEPSPGFEPSFSADCTGTIAPGDQKDLYYYKLTRHQIIRQLLLIHNTKKEGNLHFQTLFYF
jgi:hypothetical protein